MAVGIMAAPTNNKGAATTLPAAEAGAEGAGILSSDGFAGPYHHGKPELRRAEEFKYLCLDWCAKGDEEKKGIFYNKIIEKIEEIRQCYAEVRIVEKYDNKALALMMLLDACFIISFLRIYVDKSRKNISSHWRDCFGFAFLPFTKRDIFLLENQIPFQVLKLLITLQFDETEEAEGFLPKFLSKALDMDLENAKIPQETEKPPIHFLEAYWRVATKKDMIIDDNQHESKFCGWPTFFMAKVLNVLMASKSQEPAAGLPVTKKKDASLRFAHRSAMELKAKGIRFRAIPDSRSYRNIAFTSRAYDGELRLPAGTLSDMSTVICSNLKANEVTTKSYSTPIVLSYVMFMKSLIQSTEDTRELQEKGILLNRFTNLEKAVELFKEIDTFGLQDTDIFTDVKRQVEEHCNSKRKTWNADLIRKQFQTPWTAIALFAAVFLLCLTFLQTFYNIRPVK